MRLDLTVTLGNLLTIVVNGGRGLHRLYEAARAADRDRDEAGPLWAEFTERRTSARRAEDRE
jgi:hypothetical protein